MLVQPFFLESAGHRCFALYRGPEGGASRHVLFVPGFNEEMNRCRSMLTFAATALAQQGIGSLVLDLHGTGESEGEYADARWDIWLRNLSDAVAWLESRGACVALIGVRLGAVLAADWLRAAPPSPARGFVLWQPVVDGKSYLNQFLRIRIAANMDRSDLPKETTQSMRDQWARGECVEVAGYAVHPDLAQAIDQRRLAALVPPAGTAVSWLSHLNAATGGATPAESQVMAAWREAGLAVDAQCFEGQAFWQVHERATAPDLVDRTCKLLAS